LGILEISKRLVKVEATEEDCREEVDDKAYSCSGESTFGGGGSRLLGILLGVLMDAVGFDILVDVLEDF
jgi:hypothetical protein